METKNLLKSLKRRLGWMLCLVAFLAVGQSTFADNWACGYIEIYRSPSDLPKYKLDENCNDVSSTAINNQNFGTIGSTFILNFYCLENMSWTATDGIVGYKIDGGSDNTLSFTWKDYAYNNQRYFVSLDINSLNLSAGEHTFEFWYRVPSNKDWWINNGGSNYKFKFSVWKPKVSLDSENKKAADKYVGDYITSATGSWDLYFWTNGGWSNADDVQAIIYETSNCNTSLAYYNAEYQSKSGDNQKVKANIGSYQFKSAGEYAVKGRYRDNSSRGSYAYTDKKDNWTDNTNRCAYYGTNYDVYWEVSALPNATSQSAEAKSTSQIDLSWTHNSTKTTVMVVRYLNSATVTAPTQGQEYNTSTKKTIGAGTVIYKGTGQSLNDTGLSDNTTYKYYFYTVNNNYYSSGVSTSATTPKACAAPAQQTVSIGASKICSSSSTTISTTTSQSGYKYQLAKQNSENWDDVGDAVNGGSALSFTGINTAGTYKIYGYLSTDATCKSDMSNTVKLSVDAAPVAGTVSGGTTICDGGSVSLSRSSQSGTVDWEKSTTSATEGFSSLSSSASSYAAKSAGWYRVKVSNGVCTPVYATATQVNVDAKSSVGTITVTGSNPICEGSTTTLSVGTCVGDKKWQIYSGSDWSDVGSTDDTYITNALSDNTQYRVYAKNGVCAAVTTEATTITVNKPTVAGTITGAGDICSGETKTLSSSGATATNYKWKSCLTEDGTYVDASGTINKSTYSANPTVSTYYKLSVKNGECSWAYTAPVRVVVNNKPAQPGSITSSVTAPCVKTAGLTYNISDVATATSYTWTVPTGWSITAGGTTRSMTATAGTAGGDIKVKANNDCGSSAEQTLAVTVKPAPNVSASPDNTTAYEVITLTSESESVTWSKDAADTKAYFVKGQKAVDGDTVEGVSVNFKAPAKGSTYTITAKNKNNDCESNLSITIGTAEEDCGN